MVFLAVEHPSSLQAESKILEELTEDSLITSGIKVCESPLDSSHEEHTPAEGGRCHKEAAGTDTLDKGYLNFGCSHYRRRCQIKAPCCNEIFDCRHCHNEEKNNIHIDQKLRHDIPRHSVEKVICSLCHTEQEVQQVCRYCGVCMGRYYCGICKLYDDDTSKEQYHCDGCGICRIGGSENFFHCYKCECCYSMLLKSSHSCVERAMHQDCPVCFEYLFESRDDVIAMRCGHTIHRTCLEEMQDHSQQVYLPYLFQVSLRYVKSVGEVRLGDCSHSHASILRRQDDLDSLQRLWEQLRSEISHSWAEVPRL